MEEFLSDDTVRKLCDRAARDPGFRTRLLKHPHICIKEVAGVLVSTMLRIKFVEKDPDVDIMVVLPDLVDGDASSASPVRPEYHASGASVATASASAVCVSAVSVSAVSASAVSTSAVRVAPAPLATVPEPVITEDDVRRTPIVGDREALLRGCPEWAPPHGLVLEFGVFQGESLRLLRDVFGPPVIGYDSFAGLPHAWDRSPGHAPLPQGYFRCRPPVIDGAELVIGDFADTVTADLTRREQPIRLAHIDCDLYSSCATVLTALGPWLQVGTVLLFDELVGFETSAYHSWRQGEWRALQESGIRCRALGRTAHTQCALQVLGWQ